MRQKTTVRAVKGRVVLPPTVTFNPPWWPCQAEITQRHCSVLYTFLNAYSSDWVSQKLFHTADNSIPLHAFQSCGPSKTNERQTFIHRNCKTIKTASNGVSCAHEGLPWCSVSGHKSHTEVSETSEHEYAASFYTVMRLLPCTVCT